MVNVFTDLAKSLSLAGLLILSTYTSQAQTAEIIKLKEFQKEIGSPSDKVLVYNFWATWCAPCIAEIPEFEKVNQNDKDVKVTLVSLDIDLNPNPQNVYNFINRKKIQSRVVILDAVDPNSWIHTIDKNWSGALPATLIINTKTGVRRFVNKALKEGELEELIAEVKS